eukprot:maker-scaffold_7-snap-gene-1.2-mRNA-1 protein AED:0.01 eAED:0.08 QI:0/0/0.5/1/1/1/2/1113/232
MINHFSLAVVEENNSVVHISVTSKGETTLLKFELSSKEAHVSPLESCLWAASKELTKYALNELQIEISNKTVIELGSGIGLLGISLSFLRPAQVLLTEKNPEFALLKKNVVKNNISSSISCQELDWTNSKQINEVSKTQWDYIFFTDCVSIDVYGEKIIEALAQTVLMLVSKSTVVYFSATVRENDGLNDFIFLLKTKLETESLDVIISEMKETETEEGLCKIYKMFYAQKE